MVPINDKLIKSICIDINMDYEVVLLKPDELYLKSEYVMRRMMKQLEHNIKMALKDNDIVFDHILSQRLNILIRTPEIEEVVEICKRIPGISTISPAVITGANLDTINNTALELAIDSGLNKKNSFAIRTKRIDKDAEMSSKDIEKKVGQFVKDASSAKVDLTNPTITVYIELHKDRAYISTSREKGLGGLPVGVSGKIICVISEDKDIVAAWLLLRRGCEVVPLHFRTDEKNHQQFLNKCKVLDKFIYGTKVRPFSIKGKFNIRELEKFAGEREIKATCLGSMKPSLIKSELIIFEPLVGLSTKQLNNYKKIIFK